MSNFNVASVKQISLASLDLPNTSQQSILISCTDASTVTKVSPEMQAIKKPSEITLGCDKSFFRNAINQEVLENHIGV